MQSLRTLAILAGGAVVVSAVYAAAIGDGRHDWVFHGDDDDGRSMHHIVNGDRGEFSLREDDLAIKASWRGEFSLDATGNKIAAVDDEVDIEFDDDDIKQRIELDNEDDGLEIVYYRNNQLQPAGAESDEAAAQLMLRFLRVSGIKSEERVAALIKANGVAGVIDEFDYLEGSHAKRRYTSALTEQADLTEDQIVTLTGKLKDIESDNDLSQALQAILEHETVTEASAPALIAAAQGVTSDHDLRQLVEAFAEGPLNDGSMEMLIELYERIDSDHDLRVAAGTLFANTAMTTAQTARLLRAAADKIDSDHDMRLVLTDSTSLLLDDADTMAAWFDGYQVIDSDHDKRRALEAIAGLVDDHPDLLEKYKAAARAIDSEYDRNRALEAIGEATGE